MRVLAACLVGFVGLGALVTMAACSDTSDGNSAGAGGGSAAGSSNKAGATSSAGTAGAAANGCGFQSEACSACLGEKCVDKVNACNDVDSCADALTLMALCVCKPGADAQACIATFYQENGDPGEELTDCYTSNCMTACQ